MLLGRSLRSFIRLPDATIGEQGARLQAVVCPEVAALLDFYNERPWRQWSIPNPRRGLLVYTSARAGRDA